MDTALRPVLSRTWVRVLLAIVVVVLALVLLVALFPWDMLRGPINRYVTQKTGREFAITRKLDVKVGRTTRVFMDGIEFANPDWAQDRHLVKAEAAEVHVRLWPLIARRSIELPYIRLSRPQLGLQQEPDGRKTWALGNDTKDEKNVPAIGALVVDQGSAHYVASGEGADVRADFALDRAATPGAGPAMPLLFQARGRWQDQPFTAEGRTGDVLVLNTPLEKPFPAEVALAAGPTRLRASGSVASLSTLDGTRVDFKLQGDNLSHLYKLVGVALPETPRYAVAGHLEKQGATWRAQKLDAVLGGTDLAGDLAYTQGEPRPSLAGALRSRKLDFEDLAPVIGLKDQKQARAQEARQADAAAKQGKDAKKAPKDPNRRVLPDAPVDVSRLQSMDADVRIDAQRVVNAQGLPLDRVRTHLVLKNGVLVLDPLDLGVASGQVVGTLKLDANARPVAAQMKLDGRALELSKLVPASQSLKNSFGKLQAQVDLSSRGASVAQLLAHADGNLALLMGRGQISNILLEFAGLDGGEIVKFFVRGDQRVEVRCAALAFDVQQGVMASRAMLLDTDDTVFFGNAKVDFAKEAMAIEVRPQPKDTSILSLRSPLEVGGTFGAPKVGIDKGALAGRGIAALALGAINPLLALAATVESGPGHDADCVGTLRNVSASRAEARVEQTAPPVAGAGGKTVDDGKRMGAAPAASQR